MYTVYYSGVCLPRLAVTSVRDTLKETLLPGRDPLIVVTATKVRSSPASRMTILVFTNPNTKEEEPKCKDAIAILLQNSKFYCFQPQSKHLKCSKRGRADEISMCDHESRN